MDPGPKGLHFAVPRSLAFGEDQYGTSHLKLFENDSETLARKAADLGRRPAVLRIARELGLQPVMWNATGYDWNAPSAAVIERKVAKQIRGGDVILLHDGGHKHMGADRLQSVIATDDLIARYKAKGYEFVTIPQMMQKDSSSS